MKLLYSSLFIALGLGFFSLAHAPAGEIPAEESYTLLFAGDVMLDRGVAHQMQARSDWAWPFRTIAPVLGEADFLFGNLESVISDQGTNVGSIYSFRAKPEAMEGLAFAGFDAVSVANNHSLDYTALALADSVARLERAGIVPVGAGMLQDLSAKTVSVGSLNLGLLAYTASGAPNWQATETGYGIAWLDESRLPEIQEEIRTAQEGHDLLVVSLHFGEEYQAEPSEFQRKAARAAVDAGADLVIGHHPHVVQPVEQYKNGWIAYSLGNFVFDQAFSAETMRGALFRVSVANKKIVEAVLIPTILSENFQVRLAE